MAWLELSDKSVNQKDEEEQQSSWRKLILTHGIGKGPVQIHFLFSENCEKYWSMWPT